MKWTPADVTAATALSSPGWRIRNGADNRTAARAVADKGAYMAAFSLFDVDIARDPVDRAFDEAASAPPTRRSRSGRANGSTDAL